MAAAERRFIVFIILMMRQNGYRLLELKGDFVAHIVL